MLFFNWILFKDNLNWKKNKNWRKVGYTEENIILGKTMNCFILNGSFYKVEKTEIVKKVTRLRKDLFIVDTIDNKEYWIKFMEKAENETFILNVSGTIFNPRFGKLQISNKNFSQIISKNLYGIKEVYKYRGIYFLKDIAGNQYMLYTIFE